MRVEVAIDEARQHIGAGEYDKARDILAPFENHPKAQYWLQRMERSEGQAEIARDRLFTFRWDFALAMAIIGIFAIIIVVIGVTA